MNEEGIAGEAVSGEEKILAGLSHLGIVVWMVGVVVGLLVWFNQRDRGRFSSFQGLQAAVYQMFVVAFYFVGTMFFMGCMFLGMFGSIAIDRPEFMPILMPFGMIIIFGLMLLAIVYGVVGAVTCFMGKDFRYIIIGGWLEGYLKDGQKTPAAGVEAAETREES